MELRFIQDKEIENVNFQSEKLTPTQYENCKFLKCNFSNVDLSSIKFIDVEFIDCNMSNSIVNHTSFQNVLFTQCKQIGILFENCNPFQLKMEFDECNLTLASFYNLTIKKLQFRNCILNEVNFSESIIPNSIFSECLLKNAIFFNSNLECCDFSSAHNFSINPEENSVRGALFNSNNISGLLNKYKIKIV